MLKRLLQIPDIVTIADQMRECAVIIGSRAQIARRGYATEDDMLSEVRRDLRTEGVSSYRITQVIEAMLRDPRVEFVLPRYRGEAYKNHALSIGHGQTISQPVIVGHNTAVLELDGDEIVLEIGSGCGYQLAVIDSAMAVARESYELAVGPDTYPEVPAAAEEKAERPVQVYGVEQVDVLARMGRENLARGHANITIIEDDGTKMLFGENFFDRIIVSCAAERVPPALERELKEGGLLLIPLESGKEGIQTLTLFTKKEGKLELVRKVRPVKYVPLIEGDRKATDEQGIEPGGLLPVVCDAPINDEITNVQEIPVVLAPEPGQDILEVLGQSIERIARLAKTAYEAADSRKTRLVLLSHSLTAKQVGDLEEMGFENEPVKLGSVGRNDLAPHLVPKRIRADVRTGVKVDRVSDDTIAIILGKPIRIADKISSIFYLGLHGKLRQNFLDQFRDTPTLQELVAGAYNILRTYYTKLHPPDMMVLRNAAAIDTLIEILDAFYPSVEVNRDWFITETARADN
jgi:protein-L-isoaspartate(D-aspartate) O-methyltransferase